MYRRDNWGIYVWSGSPGQSPQGHQVLAIHGHVGRPPGDVRLLLVAQRQDREVVRVGDVQAPQEDGVVAAAGGVV